MWQWIYRLIAALLALMGAGLVTLIGRALSDAGRQASAMVLHLGPRVLALEAVVAAILILSAALILASPAGRPHSRG
ncbi:MAG: hypothetical protein ACHP7N_03100 [Caulobacterales bacterium]